MGIMGPTSYLLLLVLYPSDTVRGSRYAPDSNDANYAGSTDTDAAVYNWHDLNARLRMTLSTAGNECSRKWSGSIRIWIPYSTDNGNALGNAGSQFDWCCWGCWSCRNASMEIKPGIIIIMREWRVRLPVFHNADGPLPPTYFFSNTLSTLYWGRKSYAPESNENHFTILLMSDQSSSSGMQLMACSSSS